jgi:orotidine-5'-phosphate decarboxylase
MTAFEKLNNSIATSASILCVGLDSSLDKLPVGIDRNLEGLLEFNRRIIDATNKYSAAFKINFAFYEQYGVEGFEVLKKTIQSIDDSKFIIADAKRGDIGNTSTAYAKSCFEYFNCDSVTVNPYMGFDSVSPFIEFKNKFVFLLALTSNKGSADFQYLESNGKPLYKHVIAKSTRWAGNNNIGFVFGATHPDEINDIRKEIPDHVLLIPGIGTQGGDIKGTIQGNGKGPALINVSRDIIYYTHDMNFDEIAGERAKFYKDIFNLHKE